MVTRLLAGAIVAALGLCLAPAHAGGGDICLYDEHDHPMVCIPHGTGLSGK